jgi:hypothetical protein
MRLLAQEIGHATLGGLDVRKIEHVDSHDPILRRGGQPRNAWQRAER